MKAAPAKDFTEDFGHVLRTDRKEAGATYTPVRLAAAVAHSLVSNLGPVEDGPKTLLDPGCGDGTLTAAALQELPLQYRKAISVTCIDCDASALAAARKRLRKEFPETTFTFLVGDFVQFAQNAEKDRKTFDLIIANPPYVRIHALSEDVRNRIKSAYGLTGRTDMAFAFIMAFIRLLSPNGRAAVITSNRILSTNAGKPVREALLSQTAITEIWDLGDTRLFDAAVLPAVLFFSASLDDSGSGQHKASFTSIYETDEDAEEAAFCEDLCRNLSDSLIKKSPCGRVFKQRRGTLETDGTWRIASDTDIEWASHISRHTWKTFDELGRVSVGIKTTADKVFISKSWNAPRPELLRPLVTHHVSGRYKPSGAPEREVLYPHEMRDGRKTAVDLSQFPDSAAYLEQHRDRLEGRDYIAKAGRNWFEIWVPHSPDDWDAEKIVFRDIADKPTFWIESAGSVINGDCYWVRLNDDIDPDLIWLMLAVGNSSLIETFYDVVFNERLYAGRRRFMTRHVKRFPVPDPQLKASQEAARISRKLAQDDIDPANRLRLEREVDQLIEKAFGF